MATVTTVEPASEGPASAAPASAAPASSPPSAPASEAVPPSMAVPASWEAPASMPGPASGQAPQSRSAEHLSETVPQTAANEAQVAGTQAPIPQTFVSFVPQVCTPGQLPHCRTPPQPSDTVPQFFCRAEQLGGMQGGPESGAVAEGAHPPAVTQATLSAPKRSQDLQSTLEPPKERVCASWTRRTRGGQSARWRTWPSADAVIRRRSRCSGGPRTHARGRRSGGTARTRPPTNRGGDDPLASTSPREVFQ